MASKFLDYTGLSTFWTKIKAWVSSAVTTNGPSTSKTVTGWNEGKMTFGNIQISESQVTNLQTHLNEKAPLASPSLTGTPTAPTAATGTNTTQIATTAYVKAEITAMIKDMDAVVFKDIIAGGSTSTYGALTPAADKGDLYIVSTAGKIDGVAVEPGDWLICKVDGTPAATANNYSTVADNWGFIQVNKDGIVIGPSSATSGNVVLFDGATGKLIKDSGKTLGKSVPADAVFTDTKVTSVGNHYTPASDTSAELSAAASGATAAWSIDVVTAVQLQRDAKGHVVGVTVTSGKLPANPNSDTKVTQNSNSEDKEFPLLAKYTNNTTNETNTSKYAAGVTVNPSKKQVTATKFKGALEGNADTASAAASGSALETAVNSKATKVSGATSGNFAGLDANGDLTDSGNKASDFATSAQGAKADSAIQGVKVNGTELTPDSNKKVNITKGNIGLGNVDNTADANKNVLSASKLTTARNVDGVSFDGTGNIHHYGACSTAAATAAKTVTLSDSMSFTLAEGASVFIKFQYANGVASPTLNVNGTGAKNIYRYGSTAPGTSAASSWQANSIVHLVYDGSAWQMVGWLNDNTTYTNASLGQGYGTCSTAETTAAKAVTLSNYTLVTGGIVAVKFTYGLCASATLNVNSKGAKNIFINGAAVTATTANMVKGGDIAYFIYDGTQYQFLGTDRMEKDAVTGFSDTGTAGTNAKVTYTKGDGSTGDLMVAITDAEIEALT